MKKLVVFFVAVSLVGCGASKKGGISLGVILPFTGDDASSGPPQLNALTLAVEQINAKGGVLGKNLSLIVRDDTGDAAKATAAAQELVGLNVPAIYGADASSMTLAIAAVTANKVVQVSGGSTTPSMTTFPSGGYLFRTCPSDALQGKLLAQRARARSFSRAAVIYVNNAYGKGLADAFDANFTAAGGTVTYKSPYVDAQPSYASQLGDVYATNPQTVLLFGYTGDGAQIIKNYLTGFIQNGTFWYFSEALQSQDFITAVGASNFTFAHEGTGLTTGLGPRFGDYNSAYKQKYGTDSPVGAYAENAYDALYLIALAMASGGTAQPTSIKDNLHVVSDACGQSSCGTLYGAADYTQAVKALQAHQTINYDGASGNVDFDPHGDVVAPYAIWKVSGGAVVIVEPEVNPT